MTMLVSLDRRCLVAWILIGSLMLLPSVHASREDPIQQEHKGLTPLMVAAGMGDLTKLRALLAQDPEVNEKSRNGMTALYFAVEGGRPEAARMLLDHGADWNVQRIVNPDLDREPLVAAVAARGDIAIATMLLEHGADLRQHNARRCGIVFNAIMSGHVEFVRWLQGRKSETYWHCETGRTALMQAVLQESEPLVKLLAEQPEVNTQDQHGTTALHLAVGKMHVRLVQLLLAAGADAKKRDSAGQSPLLFCRAHQDRIIMDMLLAAGASLEQTDNQGRTLLSYVVAKGNHPLLTALKETGADLYAKDAEGNSLLVAGVMSNSTDVIGELLAYGLTMESRNKFGQTPFMVAAREGKSDMVKYLAQNGASVNGRDNNQQTALSLASSHNHPDTIKVLLGLGAK